jgi:hypothetical protein
MTATVTPTRDHADTEGIVGQIEAVVRDRLSGWIRDFRVVVRARGIVLMGCTNTYYAKQRVQHAAMTASRLPLLANEILVQ